MTYIPPPYNNIIIGEGETTYTAPTYNNIIISDVETGTGRYAIVMYQNHMVTISDTLLGTGLSPIVIMPNGDKRTRESTEGIPLVMINGHPTTLPDEDYLII